MRDYFDVEHRRSRAASAAGLARLEGEQGVRACAGHQRAAQRTHAPARDRSKLRRSSARQSRAWVGCSCCRGRRCGGHADRADPGYVLLVGSEFPSRPASGSRASCCWSRCSFMRARSSLLFGLRSADVEAAGFFDPERRSRDGRSRFTAAGLQALARATSPRARKALERGADAAEAPIVYHRRGALRHPRRPRRWPATRSSNRRSRRDPKAVVAVGIARAEMEIEDGERDAALATVERELRTRRRRTCACCGNAARELRAAGRSGRPGSAMTSQGRPTASAALADRARRAARCPREAADPDAGQRGAGARIGLGRRCRKRCVGDPEFSRPMRARPWRPVPSRRGGRRPQDAAQGAGTRVSWSSTACLHRVRTRSARPRRGLDDAHPTTPCCS